MNDDFENIAFLHHKIVDEAFQKGLKEGIEKVDKNLSNDAYNKGWNDGAIVGLLEAQIEILKMLNKNEKIIEIEIQLKNTKEIDDLIKLRRELINIQPLKGLIQLKKQSLDF